MERSIYVLHSPAIMLNPIEKFKVAILHLVPHMVLSHNYGTSAHQHSKRYVHNDFSAFPPGPV